MAAKLIKPSPLQDLNQMVDTPEHDKLRRLSRQTQLIGNFIDWLGDQGLIMCEPQGRHNVPIRKSRDEMIAEFFGVDLARFHAEKDAILESMTG